MPKYTSEEIECTECICGYSCGTTTALHRCAAPSCRRGPRARVSRARVRLACSRAPARGDPCPRARALQAPGQKPEPESARRQSCRLARQAVGRFGLRQATFGALREADPGGRAPQLDGRDRPRVLVGERVAGRADQVQIVLGDLWRARRRAERTDLADGDGGRARGFGARGRRRRRPLARRRRVRASGGRARWCGGRGHTAGGRCTRRGWSPRGPIARSRAGGERGGRIDQREGGRGGLTRRAGCAAAMVTEHL